MTLIDENLLKISRKYLFPIIEEKRDSLRAQFPETQFVDLGVGDISQPLVPAVIEGIKQGATEMGHKPYGYGPYQGYEFLRETIADVEYGHVAIGANDIFISEGINSDLCGLQELCSRSARVGIIDPAYPVYYDLNLLAGRENIVRLPLTQENHFMPRPPEEPLDIVYLTSPGNPTGVAMTYDSLKEWVDWAKTHNALLFFDAAYAAFIRSENVPKTIYEVEGAEDVAIEMRSFSKSSGFTGLRLGYCVIPPQVRLFDEQGREHQMAKLWLNRQSTKTNGVSYPIQRAGEAALRGEGWHQCRAQVDAYLAGAKKIRHALEEMGFCCVGAEDSPYIWWQLPGHDSWKWFDRLLNECHIISIPGEGFGTVGEGYLRLSGFVAGELADLAVQYLQLLGAHCEN